MVLLKILYEVLLWKLILILQIYDILSILKLNNDIMRYNKLAKKVTKYISVPFHGLQSRPPSPKRAERKVRRRPFREAGSGQNNGTR